MELIGVPEIVIISPSEIKSHLEKERAQGLSKEEFTYHN